MKTRILFLAADPSDASRLRLGQEHREILTTLMLSKKRDDFFLDERFSVQPKDVIQAILDVDPQIVHFSGHGKSNGEICLENAEGKIEPVKPEALSGFFQLVSDQVKCVILNSCYSEIQARAISEYVDYVIGMNSPISDKTAIAFSVGFYRALCAERPVEKAYQHALAELRLLNLPDLNTPILDGRKIRLNATKFAILADIDTPIVKSDKAYIQFQAQELIRHTIYQPSLKDFDFITEGVHQQFIQRIDIFSINARDECQAQIFLCIDWAKLNKNRSSKSPEISISIEMDECIALFNKHKKHNNLYSVWKANCSESVILEKWKTTNTQSINLVIPEFPEITVGITLLVDE